MRRVYIDWLRGVAVLAMIEWHVFDSWTMQGATRDTDLWSVIMYIGGLAAPLFLFLAGVSVPLAAESRIRKGATLRQAGWALQKRGWQIVGIAHLFRLQSFLLNPNAKWSSILKPDILNILGLGMVAAAFLWSRSPEARKRLVWLLAPAAAIVLLTPASRGWWWPTQLYIRFEAYIRPNGAGTFQIFPQLAFVLVGAFAGSLIAASRPAAADRTFHIRLGAAGLAILLAGVIGSFIPSPFARSEFWTTSLSLFLIRAGSMVAGLAVAWVWMQRPTAARWSPLVVFGRTSLFVYWVHVEIAYGFLTHPLQGELTPGQSLIGYLALTLFMLWLAVLWLRRAPGPAVPAWLRPPPEHAAA